MEPSQQRAQVDHHYSPTTSSASFRGVILQDFLVRPINESTHLSARPPLAPLQPPPAPVTEEAYQDLGLFGSPLPMPPSATALSLNSPLDFQFVESMMNGSKPVVENSSSRSKNRNHALASSISEAVTHQEDPNSFPFCNGGRMSNAQQSEDHGGGGGGGDRRHKRMMKNRESAARSRARKQAYTNELELEVATLTEKNTKLTRKNEELLFARAAHLPPPTKNMLQRSSTAPF